jgi:membrane fusion protein (multidrug efflux system)
MDAPVASPQPVKQTLQQRRRTWLVLLTLALVLVALLVLAWWLRYARFYESTDDAYVSGDLVNVMSQVSGTVIAIGADETDRVQAGQELVRLDATDYRIALQDSARCVRHTPCSPTATS